MLLERRVLTVARTLGESHAFCLYFAVPTGGASWQPSDWQVSASSTKQMGYPCRHGGKIWRTRSEEAAAEAKKAEGAAICTALRIPSPPNFTGKDACVHPGCPLVKGKLKQVLKMDLSSSSYNCKQGEIKHGEVLRQYRSLGIARENDATGGMHHGFGGISVSLQDILT